nr:hypothetical protein BaRGS_015260 [Batillaria attramentaria]
MPVPSFNYPLADVGLLDQCVKLVFREKRYEPNLDTVSPRQLCKANYDAVPAVFPDEEGRDLVNTLYRRSGRRTDIDSKISVGLTKDCMQGEDENIPKENFTCPGFYRCYQTGSCVHAEYVCDGVYHCPHKDDEQFFDELSSCSDLLRSDFFRVFLWVASVLAITGNAGVLIYRLFLEKERSSLTYRVLIMNLSLSDLLMGVYVAVIGGADAHFRGDYVSREAEWKQSGVCKMAGVLALVSSEVSAFAICLITLDRFLALRFPFGSRLRLNKVSAIIACCTTWAIGVILAVVPFFEPGWTFYGQTGICLPLPVTRQQFPGQGYSFGIFIVLNFVLFLFTGVGQIGIFWAVHSSAKATKQGNRQNEVTIARRLFLVIFTDFCCWFPVGLMGVLASRGTPIPGVVKVWLAIFVLPLNSALNPFLYTINTLRERRAKTKARQRIEKVSNNLHAELRSWPRDKVESLVRHCLKVNLVDKAMAMQWLDVGKENIDSVVVTSQTEDSACNETEKSQSEKKST